MFHVKHLDSVHGETFLFCSAKKHAKEEDGETISNSPLWISPLASISQPQNSLVLREPSR